MPVFFGVDYNVPLVVRALLLPTPNFYILFPPFQALPSCVSEEHPPKYEVITAGEHVRQRLAAAYGQK